MERTEANEQRSENVVPIARQRRSSAISGRTRTSARCASQPTESRSSTSSSLSNDGGLANRSALDNRGYHFGKHQKSRRPFTGRSYQSLFQRTRWISIR